MLGGLDFSQHGADGVHHRQQSARKIRRQRKLSLTKAGEKAFSHVRDFLKLAESQKAATSLDRVDGSEDAGQKFLRRRIGLKFHQLAVEPVQVLIAFDQEFLNQVVHCDTLFAVIRIERTRRTAWRGGTLRAE